MRIKRTSIFVIVFVAGFSLGIAATYHLAPSMPPAFYKSEAYFSPGGGISGRIIKAINESNVSIELAVFNLTSRDIRLALNISKSQCFRNMEDLERLEYIQRAGGHANRGYRYKISFWDDMERIRTKVKTELRLQLEKIYRDESRI